MRTPVFVLLAVSMVCLACVGHARRTQPQGESFRRDHIFDDKEAIAVDYIAPDAKTRKQALTQLLLASHPSIARTTLSLRRYPFAASPQRQRTLNGQPKAVSPRSVSKPSMAATYELRAPKTNLVSRALTGMAFTVSSILSVLAVYPFLISILFWSMVFDNTRRRGCDWTVQAWARMTLKLIGSKVSVEGLENLPPPDEAVLYAPNHCSFLDIFSLSGYLPRRFKYVSKIEILRIPLIGWAMKFAKHIAIRRSDRASQMKTFKDAVACLQGGSSLVTFPEGTRSKDGRLIGFKGGPFKMAARAGKRIVPITIVGTHLFQPPGAFLPLAVPRGVRIIVHPPVEVEPTKQGEAKALNATRAAIMSALPPSMLPA